MQLMALQRPRLLIPTTLPLVVVVVVVVVVAWPPLLVPADSSSEATQAEEVCRGIVPAPSDVRVPYPFGIQSNFRPGFRVSCVNEDRGYVAKLSLGKNVFVRIVNISTDENYVRVLMDPFYFRSLYRSTPEPMISFSLEGTPYTFSGTRNKFTTIGCDTMVVVEGAASDNYTSGCVSFCTKPANAIDGDCSGVGCCQASLRHGGLKRVGLNVTSIRSSTGVMSNSAPSSCAGAFLVDQDGFQFSKHLLTDQCAYLSNSRPVVLDWAIGSETCDQVRWRNATEIACRANSECYDSPSGVGYICNCSTGYHGNPYVGCQDIDECADPNGHPCAGKTCINREGSFHCPCPPGHRGDGLRNGSGCQRPTEFEIGLGTGLGLVVLLLAGGMVAYWETKRRRSARMKRKHFTRNGGFLLQKNISSMDASTRVFSIEEITRATNGFSSNNVVGQGGYGTVYKGVLSDRSTVVAIKKSKFMDESQVEQFVNEVVILSKVHHPNVVRLLGCCLESQVPLLVYEFVPNGALFDHVHHAAAIAHMPWEYRLRVLEETAQALAHLHTASPIPVIHRDVKSCNILLDEDYRAKVSDFGASRLVPFDQTHVTTVVQGTLGYLDPEYFHTSQLTEKSDVYSFGVVMVELLTSEKPVSFSRAERNLAAHFLMLLEENRLMDVVDYRIGREVGASHVFEVARLAKRCLSLRGEDRPTMSEVAIVLRALRKLMALHGSGEKDVGGVEFPLGRPLMSSSSAQLAGSSHRKREYKEGIPLLSS